jgi:hypothetical protein
VGIGGGIPVLGCACGILTGVHADFYGGFDLASINHLVLTLSDYGTGKPPSGGAINLAMSIKGGDEKTCGPSGPQVLSCFGDAMTQTLLVMVCLLFGP